MIKIKDRAKMGHMLVNRFSTKVSFGGSSQVTQVTHGISARVQKKISLHFSQFLKRMCYNAVEEST